ncbi:MAG: glycoside hydrolase family 16 protein [Verrucomicrobiota bacterium]
MIVPRSILIFCLGVCLQAALVAAPESSMKLVWEDNFDGKALDETKWTASSKTGVKLVDGQLSLEITPGDKPMFWRGSSVNTNGKFKTAAYGYIEASILFVQTRGHGAGFSIGNEDKRNPSASMGFSNAGGDAVTLSLGIVNEERGRSLTPKENPIPKGDYSKKFHKFGFAWTATDYRWYVDGRLVQKMTQPGTTKPMVIGLSHNGLPEAGFLKTFNDPTKGPEPMRVDWVKVYQ